MMHHTPVAQRQRHDFKVVESKSSNLFRGTIWVCGGTADTLDLESSAFVRAGATPVRPTIYLPVAQLAEHPAWDGEVAGAGPAG